MKKFSQIQLNEHHTMPHDFKNFESVAVYMKDRDREKYLAALKKFEESYHAKEIYNADYNETYNYSISQPLRNAWDTVYWKYENIFRANQFADDDNTLFSINSIAKMNRHWAKHKDKYPEIYQFLQDLEKFPGFIKELKSYIIKGRKPKPVDPNKFVKPMVPYEAKKLAIKFLEEAVNQSVQKKLLADFEKIYLADLNSLRIEIKNGLTNQGVNKIKHPGVAFAAQRVRDHKASGYKMTDKYVMISDAEAEKMMKGFAKRQVEDIIAGFLAKNSEKLGHIFAKKSAVAEHKIIRTSVREGNLENIMFFKFTDNSQFTIYTSTVYGVSMRGKGYVQYPTRFTNVQMADGSMMSTPSEEKMIKLF